MIMTEAQFYLYMLQLITWVDATRPELAFERTQNYWRRSHKEIMWLSRLEWQRPRSGCAEKE
jgi:hypothetical protein